MFELSGAKMMDVSLVLEQGIADTVSEKVYVLLNNFKLAVTDPVITIKYVPASVFELLDHETISVELSKVMKDVVGVTVIE
jgi:hypothetical protein